MNVNNARYRTQSDKTRYTLIVPWYLVGIPTLPGQVHYHGWTKHVCTLLPYADLLPGMIIDLFAIRGRCPVSESESNRMGTREAKNFRSVPGQVRPRIVSSRNESSGFPFVLYWSAYAASDCNEKVVPTPVRTPVDRMRTGDEIYHTVGIPITQRRHCVRPGLRTAQ